MRIKLYNQFLESKSEKSEDKPAYEYGCSMVNFYFDKISEIHSKIDPDDVYNDPDNPTRYGLEKDTHVTLLYGFHDGWEHDNLSEEKVNEILDISSKFSTEPIILNNISIFGGENYDVLKFDTSSSDLIRINEELSNKFKWEKFFPKYHPHCTIAYLKPGRGSKYVKMFGDSEYEVTPKEIVYSRPDETGNSKNEFTREVEIIEDLGE